MKIFSAIPLNGKRLFVKIVMQQNNMVQVRDMAGQFTYGANVGNLLSVLIIVNTVILKPAGATMV